MFNNVIRKVKFKNKFYIKFRGFFENSNYYYPYKTILKLKQINYFKKL